MRSNALQVLLVRGFEKHASWTFPKGKVNKDESHLACAIREVLEETGFDIAPLAREDQYIEKEINGKVCSLVFAFVFLPFSFMSPFFFSCLQLIKLFVVIGVPEHFEFFCKTQNEISVS